VEAVEIVGGAGAGGVCAALDSVAVSMPAGRVRSRGNGFTRSAGHSSENSGRHASSGDGGGSTAAHRFAPKADCRSRKTPQSTPTKLPPPLQHRRPHPPKTSLAGRRKWTTGAPLQHRRPHPPNTSLAGGSVDGREMGGGRGG